MTDGICAMTALIVGAFAENNRVEPENLAALIESVSGALRGHPISDTPSSSFALSADEIRRSIFPEHLISFEDGRAYRMLRRHLRNRGLTPEEYRTKWGLPSSYPMTSSNYSKTRSELAKACGLGGKGRNRGPAAI